MDLEFHKQRAAAAGIEWQIVAAEYARVRQLERDELDRAAAARADAARAQSGNDSAAAFKARHRAAFNGGDANNIRGLDVVAAGRGMTADQLYDELAAGADTLRPADDVYLDVLASLTAAPAGADEYLPLPAAAAAADITEQWLRKLVKAGRIRHRRVGRCWKVSAADVAFFARHPTAGRPRLRAGLEPAPF
jgi:hypothetical protein